LACGGAGAFNHLGDKLEGLEGGNRWQALASGYWVGPARGGEGVSRVVEEGSGGGKVNGLG